MSLSGNAKGHNKNNGDKKEESIQNMLDKAYGFARAKKHNKALDLCNLIIEDPRSKTYAESVIAFIYILRGDCHSKLNDHLNALENYITALRLAPQNAHIHFYQGQSYAALKKFADAKKAFTRGMMVDTDGNLLSADAIQMVLTTLTTIAQHELTLINPPDEKCELSNYTAQLSIQTQLQKLANPSKYTLADFDSYHQLGSFYSSIQQPNKALHAYVIACWIQRIQHKVKTADKVAFHISCSYLGLIQALIEINELDQAKLICNDLTQQLKNVTPQELATIPWIHADDVNTRSQAFGTSITTVLIREACLLISKNLLHKAERIAILDGNKKAFKAYADALEIINNINIDDNSATNSMRVYQDLRSRILMMSEYLESAPNEEVTNSISKIKEDIARIHALAAKQSAQALQLLQEKNIKMTNHLEKWVAEALDCVNQADSAALEPKKKFLLKAIENYNLAITVCKRLGLQNRCSLLAAQVENVTHRIVAIDKMLSPVFSNYWFQAGLNCVENKDHDTARINFIKAMSLDKTGDDLPEDEKLHVLNAWATIEKLSYDNPRDCLSYKTLGDAYLADGDYVKALEFYEIALWLIRSDTTIKVISDSELAAYYFARQNAHAGLGNIEKASLDHHLLTQCIKGINEAELKETSWSNSPYRAHFFKDQPLSLTMLINLAKIELIKHLAVKANVYAVELNMRAAADLYMRIANIFIESGVHKSIIETLEKRAQSLYDAIYKKTTKPNLTLKKAATPNLINVKIKMIQDIISQLMTIATTPSLTNDAVVNANSSLNSPSAGNSETQVDSSTSTPVTAKDELPTANESTQQSQEDAPKAFTETTNEASSLNESKTILEEGTVETTAISPSKLSDKKSTQNDKATSGKTAELTTNTASIHHSARSTAILDLQRLTVNFWSKKSQELRAKLSNSALTTSTKPVFQMGTHTSSPSTKLGPKESVAITKQSTVITPTAPNKENLAKSVIESKQINVNNASAPIATAAILNNIISSPVSTVSAEVSTSNVVDNKSILSNAIPLATNETLTSADSMASTEKAPSPTLTAMVSTSNTFDNTSILSNATPLALASDETLVLADSVASSDTVPSSAITSSISVNGNNTIDSDEKEPPIPTYLNHAYVGRIALTPIEAQCIQQIIQSQPVDDKENLVFVSGGGVRDRIWALLLDMPHAFHEDPVIDLLTKDPATVQKAFKFARVPYIDNYTNTEKVRCVSDSDSTLQTVNEHTVKDVGVSYSMKFLPQFGGSRVRITCSKDLQNTQLDALTRLQISSEKRDFNPNTYLADQFGRVFVVLDEARYELMNRIFAFNTILPSSTAVPDAQTRMLLRDKISYTNDPTRLLRKQIFLTRFNMPQISPVDFNAMSECAPLLLQKVSSDMLNLLMGKLMTNGYAAQNFAALTHKGILAALFPKIIEQINNQYSWVYTELNRIDTSKTRELRQVYILFILCTIITLPNTLQQDNQALRLHYTNYVISQNSLFSSAKFNGYDNTTDSLAHLVENTFTSWLNFETKRISMHHSATMLPNMTTPSVAFQSFTPQQTTREIPLVYTQSTGQNAYWRQRNPIQKNDNNSQFKGNSTQNHSKGRLGKQK